MIFKPLYCLFRFCGIYPTRSAADKYFTAISVTFTSVCQIMSLRMLSRMANSVYGMLVFSNVFILFLGQLLFFILNFVKPDAFSGMLKEATTTDDNLKIRPDIQVPSKTQKGLFALLVTLSLMQLFEGLYAHMPVSMNTKNITLRIFQYAPLIQQLVLVDLLYLRFKAINEELIQLANRDDVSWQSLSATLDTVFRVYTNLQVVIWDLNTHYFIYNAANTSTAFIFWVFRMYDYMLYISANLPLMATNVLFLTTVSFFLAHAVVCHYCAKEANRTVLLTHHLLVAHSHPSLWDKVGTFSRPAVDRPVTFTVGGLFTVDRPLITKAVVTALSCLVIAVQVKDAEVITNNVIGPSNDTVKH